MTAQLPAWYERPREEANLFNPAFTSLVISRMVGHFEKTTGGQGLPFALSFLILPMILHRSTREALPRAADTNMFGWLSEHPDLRALFPGRMLRLRPVTQEALCFALSYGKLIVTVDAIATGPRKFPLTTIPEPSTAETTSCLKKAEFLGRWFGANAQLNVLTAWGVRP